MPTLNVNPNAAGRSRRGSVLILVVALVVLLALMGTAYLSSTSNERYTAAANTVNAQGDIVAQNVADQVRDQVARAVFDQSQVVPGYRTPSTLSNNLSATTLLPVLPVTDTYRKYESEQGNPWLASRVPTLRDDSIPYAGNFVNAAAAGAPNPNLAGWDTVSWPFATTADTKTPGVTTTGALTSSEQAYQFYDPTTGNPVLSVGQVYSPSIAYATGDIVSDGLPTNRFYRCFNPSTNNPPTNTTYWMPLGQVPLVVGAQPYAAKQYYRFEPTFRVINGVDVPAFSVLVGASTGSGMQYTAVATIPAADADGDGIADAGWCLMPGGPVNGITYYYATRVVDNAAALNANTAYNMVSDYNQSGTPLGATTTTLAGYNPGLFPANVGLAQLLSDYNYMNGTSSQAQSLADYWFRNDVFHDNLASDPYVDGTTAVLSPTQRFDFRYMTQGDALYHQMVRRMDNTGWRSLGAVDAPYGSFTQADGLPLAARFCLAPADGSTSGALEPLLQELSPRSTSPVVVIPSAPYDAAAIGSGTGWFNQNFNFTADLTNNLVNTRPLRAMLVTRDGVSIRATGPTVPVDVAGTVTDATLSPYLLYIDVANPLMTPYDPPVANPYDGQAAHIAGGSGGSATTYLPGQWIRYYDAEGNWRVYRCLQATSVVANVPPDPLSQAPATNPYLTPNQYWALESWSATATKTSVNTATFPELWRGFYNVMADKWDTAANTVPDPSAASAGGASGGATVTTSTGTGVGTSTTVATSRVGVAMFKSPLRYPATAAPLPLSDIQVVQLRSAQAAVNAMDLRDVDNDVTSRNLILYDSPKVTVRRPAVCATVFGGEKQPFITKVVIVDRSGETPPKQPWVAVELYNPYVELKYPLPGEQPPDNGHAVTFHLGRMATAPTTPLQRATVTANDVYLGCRFGVIKRAVTGGSLTVTEAEDEYGSVASAIPDTTATTIYPGKYLVLVSNVTDVPTTVTLPTATATANTTQVYQIGSLVNLAAPAPTTAVPSGGTPAVPGSIAPTEMVLYRTRAATGIPNELLTALGSGPLPNVAVDPMQVYNETNLWDMDPFDQVDLNGTGTTPAVAGGPPAPAPAAGTSMSLYFRPTQEAVSTSSMSPATALDYWKCVFPIGPGGTAIGSGPAQIYTPGQGEPFGAPPGGAPNAMMPFSYLGMGFNGQTTTTAGTDPTSGAPTSTTTLAPGTPWHVIQINNTDWPCPHDGTKPTPAIPFPSRIYPVAGFARNGDMMQVPFIGSYSLATTPVSSAAQPLMVEVNSVTMDALYAEDTLTTALATDVSGRVDDPNASATNATTGVVTPARGSNAGELVEQVGRFCPLSATAKPLVPAATDPYAWAGRLFDYLTVQAPHDDYMPNADPVTYTRYLNNPTYADLPVPTPNALGTSVPTANTAADSSSVQGLININTAGWRVLSMLPLVRYTDADGPALDGTVNVQASARMALMIVKYRDQYGPFKSILDLNKVVDTVATPTVAFQWASNVSTSGYAGSTIWFNPVLQGPQTTVVPSASPEGNVPDARQGVLTPSDGFTDALGTQPYAYPLFSTRAAVSSTYSPNDGVYDDFQTKFLAVDRISNLITTRSDSYTCYVLVQGWQNGQVVSQRRSAFVLDRAPIGYQLNALGQRVLNTTPVVSHLAGG